MKGCLVRWYPDRGFGFLTPDAGGADVFLHVSNAPTDDLEVGWRLEFEIATNQRNGKPQAVNVRLSP